MKETNLLKAIFQLLTGFNLFKISILMTQLQMILLELIDRKAKTKKYNKVCLLCLNLTRSIQEKTQQFNQARILIKFQRIRGSHI